MATIVKQNKFFYYLKSYARICAGPKKLQPYLDQLERKLTDEQKQLAEVRIDYYNKLLADDPRQYGKHIIDDLRKPKTPKSYYFDTYEYARFFPADHPINYVFGDVIEVPTAPSIVKSRPISGDNKNSVILNLDKQRHFTWIKDDKDFSSKKNLLIGRGVVCQPHRIQFYEKYFDHPLCDLGQVNKIGGNPDWVKEKITIEDHLNYKFILSLEGNDVATNLKWVMSSNSIAVMPKPTYETWFMEGKLEGGKHYIEINRDYSDLEEKLQFYLDHPELCQEIINNAHDYCDQFFDKDVEDYCSIKVLEKYFN